MNKTELIEAVAERAELSKAAVNKAIDALTDCDGVRRAGPDLDR